jgi:hypothetical protein
MEKIAPSIHYGPKPLNFTRKKKVLMNLKKPKHEKTTAQKSSYKLQISNIFDKTHAAYFMISNNFNLS